MQKFEFENINNNEPLLGYNLYPFSRAVENPNLDTFIAENNHSKLFVKKFKLINSEAATRELSQYELFSNLSFVPKLVRKIKTQNDIYLGYEMIDGTNIFEESNEYTPNTVSNTLKTIINQTVEMSNNISSEKYNQLKLVGTKFSLQNPLSRGLFPKNYELIFNQDYQEISNKLQLLCNNFPGIYSDRNPGNIIKTKNGEIFEIDFGVIEATSPIFDLTKILRTNTNEFTKPPVQNISNTINKSLENEIIFYAFETYKQNCKHVFQGNFDLFYKSYLYAALNEHIFYLSKATYLLNTGQANISIQNYRKNYHQKMLPLTFEQLRDIDEPIENFRKHINTLIKL